VDDVVAGVRALRAGEADAYFQITDVTVLTATPRIIDLARERRLPLLIGDLNSIQDGVLAAYGVNYFDVGSFAAKHVERVLAGARPQDLPVEIYNKVQLGLNLRVARELGITVPQPLILRAEQVIR
jgi:putative ABC transport system substrate-binding protein